MCDMPIFSGPFCEIIPEYINYKRALGYSFLSPAIYKLREMDLFFKEMGIKNETITREMYEQWTSYRQGEQATNTGKRRQAIVGFAKYLVMRGYPDIYTGYDDNRIFKQDFIPYIFAKSEIDRIFRILADRCKDNSSYDNDAFQLMMLMYYCCGFRKSEVQKLRIRDVNFENGRITVLNEKNNVSRIVVASDSLLLQMRQIHKHYLITSALDDMLFQGEKSLSYSDQRLYGRFHILLAEAEIPCRTDGGRQRIHDVRHTFCVRTLENMQKKGFDLYTSLPLCSTYLGHKSITETEYYLRMLEEHYGTVLELTARYNPDLFPKEGVVNDEI